MSMTIAVTRNLPKRFGGFLASCMNEVSPGVYVAPQLRKAVRERIWKVVFDWSELIPTDGGLVLLWKSRKAPSGMGMRMIGWPKKELVDHEGLWLSHRELTAAHDLDELAASARPNDRSHDGIDTTDHLR